jgi:hypothetical protein
LTGALSGILGLTNFSGFIFYFATAIASAAVVAVVKCKGDVKRFVPQAHGPAGVSAPKAWLALMGLGQENLLSFLLFWIGFYVRSTVVYPR